MILKAHFFSLPPNPERKLTVDKHPRELFYKKSDLKTSPATFIKNRLQHGCFPVITAKLIRIIF